MQYDGFTPVGNELAKLYGFSPKSTARIAPLMADARSALSLGNAKRLTPQQNMAILQYHQRIKGVENNSQASNQPVEDIQHEPVEQQLDLMGFVEDVQQPITGHVEDNSQHYDPDKLARVAFYTNIDGIRKRQVIALRGFMLNALMVAIGSDSKADIPKWLNNQLFVGGKSITLQVQQLIVKELTR